MKNKMIETCKDCELGCEYYLDSDQSIRVPGTSVNREKEFVYIVVKTTWLDKAIKTLKFACIDDFFYRYEDKDYLLIDLVSMAISDNAIIRIIV